MLPAGVGGSLAGGCGRLGMKCERSLGGRGGRGRPPLHNKRGGRPLVVDGIPEMGNVAGFFCEFACLWLLEKFQWRDKAAFAKIPQVGMCLIAGKFKWRKYK